MKNKEGNRAVFTTGDIAEITGISRATVVNYCRTGKIKCTQTPLTNFRRIKREDFEKFLKKYSIPIDISKY